MKRFKYQGLGSILAGLLLAGCASTAHMDLSRAPTGAVKRFAALEASAPPLGAGRSTSSHFNTSGPPA